MRDLSEVKLFPCSCYAHALYVQRIERDLHIDYFISYRPDPTDRVEDYYIQIPLSKYDRISQRMLALMDENENDTASMNMNFEIERETEDGIIVKRYCLSINRMCNLYGLVLTRTDLLEDEDSFVWEWNSYRDQWIQLGLFIEQLEDELDDELYS